MDNLSTVVVLADGKIGRQEKSYSETFADCVKDAWDFARSNQFDKFVDTMQDMTRLAYERGRNSVFHS